MKSSSRWFLLLSCAVLLSPALIADTLVLRDGRRVEGRLIGVQNGLVEFEEDRGFGGGRRFRVDRNEVAGIQFDRNDRNRDVSPAPAPSQGSRPSGMRERQILVMAAVPWNDTAIDVRPGQEVYFDASGEVTWGPGRSHRPSGEPGSPNNPNRPIPTRPAAALIGRIGESNDYFFIGNDRGPVRMRTSGRLFLGVNDDVLQDNSGYFRVIVYY
jgi:hypothetical protein